MEKYFEEFVKNGTIQSVLVYLSTIKTHVLVEYEEFQSKK